MVDSNAAALALIGRVNEARAQAGLAWLMLTPLLNSVAQRHSDDMAQRDRLSHAGSDGTDVAMRLEQAGYRWSHCGENILFNESGDTGQAFNQWWNSRDHQTAMMSPDYSEAGIGLRYSPRTGRWYGTMVMARPQ